MIELRYIFLGWMNGRYSMLADSYTCIYKQYLITSYLKFSFLQIFNILQSRNNKSLSNNQNNRNASKRKFPLLFPFQ